MHIIEAAHGGTHKHPCVHTNKLSHWAMHTLQKNKILGESFLNVGIFFPCTRSTSGSERFGCGCGGGGADGLYMCTHKLRSSCLMPAYIALKSLDHFFFLSYVFIFFRTEQNEAPLEALVGQAHASPSLSKAISMLKTFCI